MQMHRTQRAALWLLALAAIAPAAGAQTGLIFADGFESGDTSAWFRSAGPVQVNDLAALQGTQGLEIASMNPMAMAYVQDSMVPRETTYRARFLFSPNDLELPRRRSVVLFDLLDYVAGQGRQRLLWVQLRQLRANRFAVAAFVGDGSGNYRFLGARRVGRGVSGLEVVWQAASQPGAADGGAALFVNRRLAGGRTDLANGSQGVRWARLGRTRGSLFASGSYYVDDFASFRTLAP